VSELTPAELNILMKNVDKGSKGYIAIQAFVSKLTEYASESKHDL